MLEPSTVPHFPTPANHSPVISKASSRRMMDDTSNSTNREIAAAARSMVSIANSSRKKVYNPKTALLTFLRQAAINKEMAFLESHGCSTLFDPSSNLKMAKRSWYNKRNISVKNKIFKDFKKEMDALYLSGGIGNALSQHHHWLLIKDIMGVSIGTELILLIHNDHHFLHNQRETWWSRRIKSIGTSDVKGRCHYVKYQNNLYWAIKEVTVRSNPRSDDLHRSIYTEEEILDGCTKQGGWGIGIQLENNEHKDLTFHDFIQDPNQLHLWRIGESANRRITLDRKVSNSH